MGSMVAKQDSVTGGPLNTAAQQVAELVETLEEQTAVDFDAALTMLVDNAVNFVLPAHYAGITVATRDGKVQTAAATHDYPRMLDEIQQRHGEGPCLSAAWENHIVRIDDLTVERRWPRYSRDAVDETPVRSVMCFQLFAGQEADGALNFYAEQSHAFDDDAVEAGLLIATHTALAWSMLRRDQQFRSALASRDVIGQAKGIIMERFDVNAVQAFELLKRLSQESNTKLGDIAHQLIERGHSR